MARTPVNRHQGHPGDDLPSRSDDATSQGVIIALTGSARTYAEKQGLDMSRYAQWLSPDCQTGDVFTVAMAGIRHDFAVLRRRWLVGEPAISLEITLDYPVRGR